MGKCIRKKSVCDSLDFGEIYLIDISRIRLVAENSEIISDQNYIERVIRKYYVYSSPTGC
jgi:hypothetical protein